MIKAMGKERLSELRRLHKKQKGLSIAQTDECMNQIEFQTGAAEYWEKAGKKSQAKVAKVEEDVFQLGVLVETSKEIIANKYGVESEEYIKVDHRLKEIDASK